MTRKTILLTGGSGFTGQYFTDAANSKGYHCVALAQPESSNCPGAEQTYLADLLDRNALAEAIRQIQPDYIVHMAAIAFVAHENTAEIYNVNQLGTINLLDAVQQYAIKTQKIILASSANIYGNKVDLPIVESAAPEAVNHYSMSKYAMELASRLYGELPIVIVRPFNYTGRGQRSNFLVPKIVSAFQSGQRVIELGNLDVSRDFSDVRDVADAYLCLLKSGKTGETYNICSGTPTSLLEIVEKMNSLAGYGN